ncbi:hypothetical protein Vspart_00240 [Vibrio spartinae]|uniref:Uncharacterized protein n=1 Tax=Vibrio spartinae TaxID=1918945 RepID=A0A1N6M2K4_9VIBR|nr:hypothetical protein Vspart_00240 [Vibrio spartinae]SIO93659.1 hypothetical protein VSP9026_01329 [Vibrio spartinae]
MLYSSGITSLQLVVYRYLIPLFNLCIKQSDHFLLYTINC